VYPHRILVLLLVVPAFLIPLPVALFSRKPAPMNQDADTPNFVGEFPCPESHGVGYLMFTPDNKLLVGLALDRTKRQGVNDFWDVSSRKLIRTLIEPDTTAAAIFTPDGKRLITSCWDNKMRIYSMDQWKLEQTFDHDPPNQTANCLAIFPDGKKLLSGNSGYSGPRVWDMEERTATPLPSPRVQVHGVAIFKDGKRFAIMYGSYFTEIWDTEKMEVIGKLKLEVEPLGGRTGVFTSIALSPDGSTIATGCLTKDRKQVLYIWDAKNFKLLHESQELEECPRRICYTPDGKLIVTSVGSRKDQVQPGIVYIWDAKTGKLVHRFQCSRDGAMESALSPDGHWLVTRGDDDRLRLWDFAKIRKDIGK
jgi:WD40 repeat protein